MYKLLYAGVDTLDVAIAGALPAQVLNVLEEAKVEAAEKDEPVLVTVGPGNVNAHVQVSGAKHGYAYRIDTGPDGAIWKFRADQNVKNWNIFVSPHATALLSRGYEGTRDMIWETLSRLAAKILKESINRVDFAMDFAVNDFNPTLEQFCVPAGSKLGQFFDDGYSRSRPGKNSAVFCNGSFESITIGRQPGRQIIIYNKRREAVQKRKQFWFDAWNIDPKHSRQGVWRVEVRAGKDELKKYGIKQFLDLESGLGDVIVNSLCRVRYLDSKQSDSNVSRQKLHPLWLAAQFTAERDLINYRSGLTRDQVRDIARHQAVEQYKTLAIGNAIGLGVAYQMTDQEIVKNLPSLLESIAKNALSQEKQEIIRKISRARRKYHFII